MPSGPVDPSNTPDRTSRAPILRPWLADIYGSPRRSGRRRRSPGLSTGLAGLAAARRRTRPHGPHRIRAPLCGRRRDRRPSAAWSRRSTSSRSSKACRGGSGTDFGVPSAITAADRLPVVAADAERLGRPRRGGVDGLRPGRRRGAGVPPQGATRWRSRPRQDDRPRHRSRPWLRPGDRRPTPRAPSRRAGRRRSGTGRDARGPATAVGRRPLAERKWTQRYAARRIAWHALDHAWEMEDRSDPAIARVGRRVIEAGRRCGKSR